MTLKGDFDDITCMETCITIFITYGEYDKQLEIQAGEVGFGDQCKHPLMMVLILDKSQASSPRKFKKVSI